MKQISVRRLKRPDGQAPFRFVDDCPTVRQPSSIGNWISGYPTAGCRLAMSDYHVSMDVQKSRFHDRATERSIKILLWGSSVAIISSIHPPSCQVQQLKPGHNSSIPRWKARLELSWIRLTNFGCERSPRHPLCVLSPVSIRLEPLVLLKYWINAVATAK